MESGKKRAPAAALLLLAVLVGIYTFAQRTWLAPERATINGEATTLSVLKEENDQLVILIPKRGAVLRLPSTAVLDRQYCYDPVKIGDATIDTIADKVFGRPQGLPECP